MSLKGFLIFGFCAIALTGIFLVVGCCDKTRNEENPPAGPAEKAGAVLDKAVETTAEEARRLAEKAGAKAGEISDKAIKKTGEALEKAGEGLSRTGVDLQSDDSNKNP